MRPMRLKERNGLWSCFSSPSRYCPFNTVPSTYISPCLPGFFAIKIPPSFSGFLSISVTAGAFPQRHESFSSLSPTSSDLMASVASSITHLRGCFWLPSLIWLDGICCLVYCPPLWLLSKSLIHIDNSLENVSRSHDSAGTFPRADMKAMTASQSHGGKVRVGWRKVSDAWWSAFVVIALTFRELLLKMGFENIWYVLDFLCSASLLIVYN